MTAKARDILKGLGYAAHPADSTSSFYGDGGIINFARSKGHNMEQWAEAFAQSPSAAGYWYRQGRTPLAAERITSFGSANINDPPVTVPGMLTVVMDLDGSLRRFAAVPPEREPPPSVPAPPDWKALFAAAHLDPAKFTPAEPEWSPSVVTDTRAAWTGPYRDRTDLPVRIEAASFHGRPVYFQIIFPWTSANRFTPTVATTWEKLRSFGSYTLGALVLLAALIFAHYNWKAGRGDLRGATRVGAYCAVMSFITWAFGAHHVGTDAEQDLISDALAQSAYFFVEYWLIYLALEPWVRRYWPQALITWSRVLAGKWRDPMVGRDLLFGTLLGAVYLLLIALYEFVNLRAGAPITGEFSIGHLNGFRVFAWLMSYRSYVEVGGSLMLFLTLFLARALLKKQWLFVRVWVLGWLVVRFLRQGFIDSRVLAVSTGVFWLLLLVIMVAIMLRLGFFAFVVAAFVLDTVTDAFFTTDFLAWYGQSSVAIVIVVAAIALIGFRLSLGSRPLFSPAAFEKA